eukprot:420458_1
MAQAEEKVDDQKEALGFFERPKIFARYKYGTNNESTLIEFEGVKHCNKSILIEALKGIGTTSTVVGAHIIGVLKLPCIAVFVSSTLPAMTSVHKFMPTSAIRIYGNKNVCVAISDYALHSTERSDTIWQICQSLVDFSRRHQCQHIISVDGFPVKDKVQKQIDKLAKMHGKDPNDAQTLDLNKNKDIEKKNEQKTKDIFETVHYLTTDKSIAETLQKDGHKGIKTMQIMGATGAMMQLAFCGDIYCNDVNINDTMNDDNNKDIVLFSAMLAPDPIHIPDRRGALLTIRLLRDIWGLKQINLDALQKDADRLQKKIEQTVTEIASQMQQQRRIQMAKAAPPAHMYV